MLAAVPLLTAPVPAAAQSLIPPLGARNGLSNDDLDRMNAAATRLCENRPAGSVEDWRNPKTRNAGSVKLLRRFETDGMPCWRMEYTIRFERVRHRPRQYRVNWCRTDTGELRIVEHPSRAAGE